MNAIIATTPAQMQEASRETLTWVQRKIAGSEREVVLANETITALEHANASTAAATRQLKLARARLTFYTKVRAAIDAGYYIIPPFAVQPFAIRVPENRGPRGERERRKWVREQTPAALPAGEGVYVHPEPKRERVDSETETRKDGTTTEVAIYENVDWRKVDIPVLAQKPQIIDAIAGALESRIFDALGIAPAYRAADPIVVGQIRHWRTGANPLTFFVAWWLDEGDL